MTLDELQALHNELWTFRDDMADAWPTPGQLDSLRFAATEAAESLDAWLRLKGGYARNNDKALSVEAELADTAMMLMTALGREYRYYDDYHPEPELELIMKWVVDGLDVVYTSRQEWNDVNWVIQGAIYAIDTYPGMDLAVELRKRMARIRAKHGGEHATG